MVRKVGLVPIRSLKCEWSVCMRHNIVFKGRNSGLHGEFLVG